MRRDQGPHRDQLLSAEVDNGTELFSQRPPPNSVDLKRGSHVTPIAPATEPTDPFSSRGPLARPPSWLPLDDFESANSESEVTGSTSGPDFMELYAEIGVPQPRDTVPAPPPTAEDAESNGPPTIVDPHKT
jgi:hypothetical protein